MSLEEDLLVPNEGAVFGLGAICDEAVFPKLWIKNDPIIELACGDEHGAMITESGRVFTFGKNDWGQLGLAHKNTQLKPACVKYFKENCQQVKLVACGRNHTIVYTDSHAIFGFGSNDEGQLGNDDHTMDFSVPQQMSNIPKRRVVQLAAGGDFSALLTDAGQLYMWGCNSEGQLGLGLNSAPNYYLPQRVFVLPDRGTGKQAAVGGGGEETAIVKQVSCGHYHVAAVSDDGRLFVWGEAEQGKLGLPPRGTEPQEHLELNNDCVMRPMQLRFKTSKSEDSDARGGAHRVTQVAAGHSHTLCIVDREGRGQPQDFVLMGWGDNTQGQLGLGGNGAVRQEIAQPRRIKFGVTVKQAGASTAAPVLTSGSRVAAGQSYSCVIDGETGALWACGDNRHNKLGIEREDSAGEFVRVDCIYKSGVFQVSQVVCGGCHLLALVTRPLAATSSVAADAAGISSLIITPRTQQQPHERERKHEEKNIELERSLPVTSSTPTPITRRRARHSVNRTASNSGRGADEDDELSNLPELVDTSAANMSIRNCNKSHSFSKKKEEVSPLALTSKSSAAAYSNGTNELDFHSSGASTSSTTATAAIEEEGRARFMPQPRTYKRRKARLNPIGFSNEERQKVTLASSSSINSSLKIYPPQLEQEDMIRFERVKTVESAMSPTTEAGSTEASTSQVARFSTKRVTDGSPLESNDELEMIQSLQDLSTDTRRGQSVENHEFVQEDDPVKIQHINELEKMLDAPPTQSDIDRSKKKLELNSKSSSVEIVQSKSCYGGKAKSKKDEEISIEKLSTSKEAKEEKNSKIAPNEVINNYHEDSNQHTETIDNEQKYLNDNGKRCTIS